MSRRAAAPYLRILLAWLLAMQPMIGAYAAAGAAATPVGFELCRGGPAPGDADAPDRSRDHSQCCLAACLGAAVAPPVEQSALSTPHFPARAIAATPPRQFAPPFAAGFGPQAARAPPL